MHNAPSQPPEVNVNAGLSWPKFIVLLVFMNGWLWRFYEVVR